MAITSANTNINQMATTSPSAIMKLAITPAKNKTQVANSKGNVAITSANNIKLPKKSLAVTSAKQKIKHNESTKLQGSPTLLHHYVLEMPEVNIFLRPGRSHV